MNGASKLFRYEKIESLIFFIVFKYLYCMIFKIKINEINILHKLIERRGCIHCNNIYIIYMIYNLDILSK